MIAQKVPSDTKALVSANKKTEKHETSMIQDTQTQLRVSPQKVGIVENRFFLAVFIFLLHTATLRRSHNARIELLCLDVYRIRERDCGFKKNMFTRYAHNSLLFTNQFISILQPIIATHIVCSNLII